jgi:hypothetical protein
MLILLLLLVLSLIVWIYAERRLSLVARISSGAICILLLGGNCYFVTSVGPNYESKFHKRSIQLSGELIAKGEIQRVQQAFSNYTNSVATDTTYHASKQMWEFLNQGQKK